MKGNLMSNLSEVVEIVRDNEASRFALPFLMKANMTPENRMTIQQKNTLNAIFKMYKSELEAKGWETEQYQVRPNLARRVEANCTKFHIYFPFNADIVKQLKDDLNAHWNSEDKRWELPIAKQFVADLVRFSVVNDFDFSQAFSGVLKAVETEAEFVETPAIKLDLATLEIAKQLRPFQVEGVQYALNTKRCFIADEQGLGKTCQSIVTVKAANAFPALVVCPASMKLTWGEEVKAWLPQHTFQILNGSETIEGADFTILSYKTLKKYYDAFKHIRFKTIIFDESHWLGNYRSQRTKQAIEISQHSEYVLCLTGTPIDNRTKELPSQLDVMRRLNEFGGQWHFFKEYCAAKETKFGWDVSGASNLDDLHRRLRSTCFIRRMKSDVAKEIPPKQRQLLPIELSNAKEYARAETDFIKWIKEQAVKKTEFLRTITHLPSDQQEAIKLQRQYDAAQSARKAEEVVKIQKLRRLATEGKLQETYEWIEDFLATGQKLVVFAWHQEIVEKIAAKFDAPYIHGSVKEAKRHANVKRFQTDPNCNLIVLNFMSGGVGLTLTAASNIAFVEFGWTPGTMDQAEDRVHRISQTESVTCYYLVGKDSIDKWVVELIEKKRVVVERVVNGKQVDIDNSALMRELVKHFETAEE